MSIFCGHSCGVLDTGLWRSDDDAEEIFGMAALEMTRVVRKMKLRFLVSKTKKTNCKPGSIYTFCRVAYDASQEQHQGSILCPSLSPCFVF